MSDSMTDETFDEQWYLETYSDVANAISQGSYGSGFEHYIRYGRAEGRHPVAFAVPRQSDAELSFDEAWYLETYPDVAEQVRCGNLVCGYEHWIANGKSEGRFPSPGYSEGTSFNAEWYAARYPGVQADIAAGRARDEGEHFEKLGRFRGYLPNPFAPRPDNPAGIASRFGGLWPDQGNALDLIEGKLELGRITESQADLLRFWVEHGYVILRQAVDPEQATKAALELDRAYSGQIDGLRFECPPVGGYSPVAWTPEVLRNPAKALDLHWWSAPIRELIFAPLIREFLELLFDRKTLATQTLTFLRGSAQGYHQDTVYVPYSLPTQFAASWIALEDVQPNAGELTYLEGSHKLPDYLYAGQFKTVWDAQRMLRSNSIRDEMKTYSQDLESRALNKDMKPSQFMAKKGDVLLWHADLAHGGLPISQNLTRKSVVTHYCPAEIVPLFFERGAAEIRPYENLAYYATGYYADKN